GRSTGRTTTVAVTWRVRSMAARAWASIGRPARSKNCLATSAPNRSPLPPARTTAVTNGRPVTGATSLRRRRAALGGGLLGAAGSGGLHGAARTAVVACAGWGRGGGAGGRDAHPAHRRR